MYKFDLTAPIGFVSVIHRHPLSKVCDQDQLDVENFIKRRHEYFGAQAVMFCDSSELEQVITKLRLKFSGPITVTSTYEPFTDFDALSHIGTAEAAPSTIVFKGMVPGTAIQEIRLATSNKAKKSTIFMNTQEAYGSQLNLRKYKRLKLFLSAIKKWPHLTTTTIADLMNHLKEHQTFFLNYGVEAPLVTHKKCPHCNGKSMRALPANYSQALTGHSVTGTIAYYECLSCGLIVMSPHLQPEHFHKFYDEYDAADMFFDEKDILNSPPRHNHQLVIDRLASLISKNTENNHQFTSIDIGGGPGLFSVALKKRFPKLRVIHGDFDTRNNSALKTANVETRQITLPHQSIGKEQFDVVTAFEVVEHFDYSGFKLLIENILTSLRPGGVFAFTTPDYDSPMLQAFDWYNIGLPHHPIIFRRSWLKALFESDYPNFTLVDETGGDDFMRDQEGYFSYFQETASRNHDAAIAKIMSHILSDPLVSEKLRKDFMQTEVILFLQKDV